MFGVNEKGEDTLAGQFARNPETRGGWSKGLSLEKQLAFKSNLDWLRRIQLDKVRAHVLERLQQMGALPSDANIAKLVEEELLERARRMTEAQFEEQARMISPAAVFRSGGQ